MVDWYLRPEKLAKAEIQQAESVGHDCSHLLARLAALPKEERTPQQRVEAVHIYRDALSLATPAGYAYAEPSTLAEIRDERPGSQRPDGHSLSEKALRDRILGGWLGRAAGCLLGKGVEGWGKGFRVPREDVPTREEVEEFWTADKDALGI